MTLSREIEAAGTIAISGHVRPDGDCVGACLSVYNYIKDNYPGKTVRVFLEYFSETFLFLRGADKVERALPGEERFDLFISLDCADKERLGDFQPLLSSAVRSLVIDHHITNKGFGDTCRVCPEASSTCEALFELMDEERISLETASCLYLGLVHDTGVFKHSNTTRKTMEIAGRLLDKGVSSSYIIDETFYKKTFTQNKALGYALQSSILLGGGLVVAGCVSLEQKNNLGLQSGDMDGIIDQLRVTDGTMAAIFVYETEPGSYKVSMRSKDPVDVSRIAMSYGGGGHVRAAGCQASSEDWKKLARDLAEKIMDQLQ